MSRTRSLLVLLVVLLAVCLFEVEMRPIAQRMIQREFRFPPEAIALGYVGGVLVAALGVTLAIVCRSPVRGRYDCVATLVTAFLGLLLAGTPRRRGLAGGDAGR